jgi:molybdate transport system substrate-binding protein
MRFRHLLGGCLLGIVMASSAVAADAPPIAAASDLRFVLGEVAVEFTKETGRDVRITYAASGTLVNQI